MRRTLLPLLATAALLPACSPEEHGPDLGASFSMRSCGLDPCNIDTPMVSNSRAEVVIESIVAGQVQLDGATLVSDDPEVVDVDVLRPDGLAARATIVAGRPGLATLTLTDRDGEVRGDMTLEVADADQLSFVPGSIGGVIFVDHVDGIGPHFTVAADTLLEIDVTPYGAGEQPLRGVLEHTLEIDETGAAPEDWLQPFDDAGIAAGHFSVRVTPGDHDLSVEGLGSGAPVARFRLTGT